MKRCCRCCGKLFGPDRYHPNQGYCSSKECQQFRRNKWQRHKMLEDEDYRANQASAQKRWLEAHADYYKQYRARHTDYVERNRGKQESRRKRALNRGKNSQNMPVAKMDVALGQEPVESGRYRLEFIGGGNVAKMDVAIVQLSLIELVTKNGMALQRENFAP